MSESSGVSFTWRQLLQLAEFNLRSSVDARRIVEAASGFEGAEYFLNLDRPATEGGETQLNQMVKRRMEGEPLQYVIGRWSFRNLDLLVDRRVLIPRPETEVVVEAAVHEGRRLSAGLVAGEQLVAVDLGTGSGAIALSLAVELAGVDVWGVERSADALAVAQANLAGLGSRRATRVHLEEGDWYKGLPAELRGKVHLLVSNPPYVAEGDDLPAEVTEWEPAEALVAGPTGLEAIDHILAGAPEWLSRPGSLVLEIAPHQVDAVKAIARDYGFTDVTIRADLNARPRVFVARV